jgi:bisanhydrobacterioruberin hydratase
MAVLKHYYVRISSIVSAYSLWIVVFLHIVGLLGMLSPVQEYFRLLTPFNLMTCALLLWINHRHSKMELVRFSLFVFFLGFMIEFIGTQTGWPFGHYTYGTTLGPRIFGVPIIIGLNWLLITYCVSVFTDSLNTSIPFKILMGTFLAVGIDILIEPVAMKFNFWNWSHGSVPLQNYVGWFMTSLVMNTSYHLFNVKSENKLALPLYLTQLMFFLILTIAIRL